MHQASLRNILFVQTLGLVVNVWYGTSETSREESKGNATDSLQTRSTCPTSEFTSTQTRSETTDTEPRKPPTTDHKRRCGTGERGKWRQFKCLGGCFQRPLHGGQGHGHLQVLTWQFDSSQK